MPALRPLRELRPLRASVRKPVDLSLPPELIGRTAAVYRRVIDLTAEAIEADLVPWIRGNFRADATYPGDLDAVRARVRAKFPAGSVDALLGSVARAVDDVSFAKLARVPGIDPGRIVPGGPAELDRFRRVNAQLIQSVPERMALDVAAVLAEPGVRELHARDVAEILQARFGVSEARALFWARDQTLKLYARLQEARQRAAGASSYQWETSVDERVRGRPGGMWANNASNHWVLHDTIQRWDLAPITNPRTGARNHPGHDYQCRCSAYPIFDDAREVAPPPPPETTPEEEAAELIEVVELLPEPPPFEPPRVQVQVPPPPPPPPAPPPEPVRSRAAELYEAFNQVGETRSKGGSKIRDTLREEIELAFPEAATKDLAREKGRQLLTDSAGVLDMMGADGAHYPDTGAVIITKEVRGRAQAALRELAAGRAVPTFLRDSVRILVHEEAHGFSRSAPASYDGIGKILEEVGTELTARHVTGKIFGAPHEYGAYGEYIERVRTIVAQPGKNTDKLIREAHARAVLSPGPSFTSPSEHLDAFVAALDVDEDEKPYIRGMLETLVP